jgi:hypothetical protein
MRQTAVERAMAAATHCSQNSFVHAARPRTKSSMMREQANMLSAKTTRRL